MVTSTLPRDDAWRIAASVPDPEVPVLTIEDLGVLRAVEVDGDRVHVDITPTYSGCPAMDAIRDDVILVLTAAGFAQVDVRLVLSPAWTTDWMSDAGKRKLEEYGIAPPSGRAAHGSASLSKGGPIRLAISVRCPRCGSLDTREVSRFGSTSCKALFECRACLEPFDHFKVH
jgi:ring-1,2-phenylacetyl-CoA epoxidase subunit PaaD